MNPIPMVFADVRSLRWLAWSVPILVALAVAVGIGVAAQNNLRLFHSSTARLSTALRPTRVWPPWLRSRWETSCRAIPWSAQRRISRDDGAG